MNQIALIDFCRTAVNFQTSDPFLEYVLQREHPVRCKLLHNPVTENILQFFTRVLRVFGIRRYLYKLALIRQVKGLTYDELEAYGKGFYIEKIRPNLLAPTMELLAQFQEAGYIIIIVSGAFEFYINEFAKEHKIDRVITSHLGFDENNVCTGRLVTECMFEDKLADIEKMVSGIDDPKEMTVACSDSRSDLPMLSLCKRKIVLSEGKHQRWVTKDMEEIIWH